DLGSWQDVHILCIRNERIEIPADLCARENGYPIRTCGEVSAHIAVDVGRAGEAHRVTGNRSVEACGRRHPQRPSADGCIGSDLHELSRRVQIAKQMTSQLNVLSESEDISFDCAC